MKSIIFLPFTALSLLAAPINNATNTATLAFNMVVDNTQMGGLSTNQYATNFNVVIVTSPDIRVPLALWTPISTVPVSQLLTQGSPPATWTNQVPVDGATRFFSIQYTNWVNGGTSPFFAAYPLFWTFPSGSMSGVVKP